MAYRIAYYCVADCNTGLILTIEIPTDHTPAPPQNPPYNPPKPKKKRKTKKKKEIGAKCTILFTALHPQAIVDEIHPKESCTNKERLSDYLMMEQVKSKIKDEFKLCIIVKYEDYGDDLLYCAARFPVVISEGSEDDYFATAAPITPDLPVLSGDGTDNSNEINDNIYHAWNMLTKILLM